MAAHLSQKVVKWRASSAAGRARCERETRSRTAGANPDAKGTFGNSEIIGDRVQVAAGLIDLSHVELALVWHGTL